MSLVKNDKVVLPIYANGVTINFSIFEGRMEFVVDTPNYIKNEMLQETVADIRMSPALAKALALYLLDNVQNYEKQFGTLPHVNIIQGSKNE